MKQPQKQVLAQDSWRFLYPTTTGLGLLICLLAFSLDPFDRLYSQVSILISVGLYALLAYPMFKLLTLRPHHFSRYSLLSFSWLLFLAAMSNLFLSVDDGLWFSVPNLVLIAVGLLFAVLSMFNSVRGDKTMIIIGYNMVMLVAILACAVGLIFILVQLFG